METQFDEDTETFSEWEEKEAKVTHGLMTAPIHALHPKAAICVQPDDTVATAVRIMNSEKIGALMVQKDDRLVGIFTERDVLFKIAGRGLDFTTIHVAEFMTKDPEALSHDHKVAYALNKMVIGGFRHVPIVDHEHRPMAMLSVRDIVEFIVEQFPEDVINLPPDPAHEMRKPYGG